MVMYDNFYKKYNLDEAGTAEIKKFFNFVADPRSASLSTLYNLLLISKSKDDGASFSRDLAQWLSQNTQSAKKRVCICSESEILDHFSTLDTWLNPYCACIIEADKRADRGQMDQIKAYVEANPDKIFVLSTSPTDVDQRIRTDDHLFFRVFPYHIQVDDPTGEILTARLLRMLEDNEFTSTDAFKDGLTTYNTTVYPKADLKGEAYLQDLFRRVINNHLGSGNTSQCIEKESVPHYRMPAALDVSALPLEEGPLAPVEAPGNEYNVLFMALSTFPPANSDKVHTLGRCSFPYTDAAGAGRDYSYYYQLEPVPRMLSMKFRESGLGHIDKLILLCSKATTTPAQISIGGQTTSISPCEFLKARLAGRINPAADVSSVFQEIEVDTDHPAGGIRETVQYIRALKKEHENLRLYVDRHGGFRSIQGSVNAMLSLLKSEMDIKQIYDLNFSTKTRVGTIVEADPHDLFDFVSGINEFTNYGRIKSLEEFYSGDDRNELMRHIARISEGIQLCDIATFEEGISDISNYFNAKNAAAAPADEGSATGYDAHEYLSLFEDKIYADYKNILDAPGDRRVLEEIDWCRRKGFFQQALTLIEARMPSELKSCGVFSYNQALADYAADGDKSKKYNYQTVTDFIFNQTVMNALNESKVANRIRAEYRAPDGSRPKFSDKNAYFRERYIKDCLFDDHLMVNLKKRSGESAALLFCDTIAYSQVSKADPAPAAGKVSFVYDNPRELFAFLQLHAAFKSLRNEANHASREGIHIPTAAIDKALSFYYEHGKNLEDYAIHHKP